MSRLGNEVAIIAKELGSEVTFSTGDMLIAVKEIRKALDKDGTYSDANKAANIMEEVTAIRELVEDGALVDDITMDEITVSNKLGVAITVVGVEVVDCTLKTTAVDIANNKTGKVYLPKIKIGNGHSYWSNPFNIYYASNLAEGKIASMGDATAGNFVITPSTYTCSVERQPDTDTVTAYVLELVLADAPIG